MKNAAVFILAAFCVFCASDSHAAINKRDRKAQTKKIAQQSKKTDKSVDEILADAHAVLASIESDAGKDIAPKAEVIPEMAQKEVESQKAVPGQIKEEDAAQPGLGRAPAFDCVGARGKTHSLAQYKGSYVVLEWFNPDCPFVKKHYDSGNMQNLQKKYTAKGVIWLTVNSSAVGKQGHYLPKAYVNFMKDRGGAPTAVLLDHDGRVGRKYEAKTTPHLFVINPAGKLIYRGAIDDKRSADAADVEGANNYVAAALDEAMAEKELTTASTQSYGCSVKY